MNKTAEATKNFLSEHKILVYEGRITLNDVVVGVRKTVPGAKRAGVYDAIEEYGPIGENDHVWLNSPIKQRYYTPKRIRYARQDYTNRDGAGN